MTIFGSWCIVFGGDRHHMPFNDLFVLDLERELANQHKNNAAFKLSM
jgi:hypothetical protein